jgi:hypothetical protein
VKHKATTKDWLPLARGGASGRDLPTGEAFQCEWVDFERGIRVGHLEPHERITQILKFHLEQRYRTPFVTDRWGRGVYWQWICWLPKTNRAAKPLSSGVNFGCAKYFITAERDARVFKSGLQIERGYARGPEPYPGCLLRDDWDWHRLIRGCRKGSALDAELGRLVRKEGFRVELGDWAANAVFDAGNYRSAGQVRAAAQRYSDREWLGFQLYYPMPEAELKACTGFEFTRAVCGVFDEVTAAMNLCMQVDLTPCERSPFDGRQAKPDTGAETGAAPTRRKRPAPRRGTRRRS